MLMENEKSTAGETGRINWHPAFVEAIQMELDAYKDNLEFHSEYQLTSEPLRIDCVIIKKPPDLVIEKNIAVIFREFNLIEYKSPDDYVSIADFYKVYGYACLYASLEKVPITSMTVSFIESRRPDKLLAHFKNVRKYSVEKTACGIYTVKGDILPIQVIESPKLSVDENLWLNCLRRRLAPSVANYVGEEAIKQGKGARITAYFEAITQANPNILEEIYKMRKDPTFEEALKQIGILDKVEAESEKRGEEKERQRILELIQRGYSIEELKVALN
jgi:hypothetical protein